jgi:hypothetical protein
MQKFWRTLASVFAAAAAVCLLTAVTSPPVNVPVTITPSTATPLWGLTFDNVSSVSSANTVLTSMVHRPTTRIVFDTGQNATSIYLSPLTTFHANSDIMGLLIDSSYMPSYTAATAATWTQNYYNALKGVVDIWEIGNEVNGNWLSTCGTCTTQAQYQAEIMGKIAAQYDNIVNCGGGGCSGAVPKTALTFFYEGEPSDPHNCIGTDHGGDDMFSWINEVFVTNQTAETERIRLGINYALVSWYPDQCPNTSTPATLDMPTVFTKLGQTFPNAQVGFGEIGLATSGSCTNTVLTNCAFLKNLIDTYYSARPGVNSIPNNFMVGNFLWYTYEWLRPWPGVTNATFPSGMGAEVNAKIQ